MQANPNEEFERIALSSTLEFIHANEWEDSDGFGLVAAREYSLLRRRSASVDSKTLEKRIKRKTGFFRFNNVTKASFFERLCKQLNKNPQIKIEPIYRDEVIVAFENDLRAFVESKLRQHLGSKWQKAIPPTSLKEIKDTRRKQLKAGEPRAPLLAYTTVGQLFGVIQKNWSLFSSAFRDMQWLEQKLTRDYSVVRNPNAHSRRLIKDYETRRNSLINEIRGRMS